MYVCMYIIFYIIYICVCVCVYIHIRVSHNILFVASLQPLNTLLPRSD